MRSLMRLPRAVGPAKMQGRLWSLRRCCTARSLSAILPLTTTRTSYQSAKRKSGRAQPSRATLSGRRPSSASFNTTRRAKRRARASPCRTMRSTGSRSTLCATSARASARSRRWRRSRALSAPVSTRRGNSSLPTVSAQRLTRAMSRAPSRCARAGRAISPCSKSTRTRHARGSAALNRPSAMRSACAASRRSTVPTTACCATARSGRSAAARTRSFLKRSSGRSHLPWSWSCSLTQAARRACGRAWWRCKATSSVRRSAASAFRTA